VDDATYLRYFVRAYYDDDCFVDSGDFIISLDMLRFTEYPYIYNFYPETGEYVVFWKTSFKPEKIRIYHYENDSILADEITDDVLTSGFDTHGAWVKKPDEYISRYFIEAHFRDGDKGAVTQSVDLSASSLGFTSQPVGGSYIEGPATYPISWTTNFVPRKVQVIRNDNSVVKTIANDLNNTMSFDIPATAGDGSFKIRAFYADGDDFFVQSVPFEVTYPGPMFTKQPQSGGATETTAHEAHWNTSFTPLRLELWSLKAGEHEKIGELNAAATAQAFTYSQAIQYNDRSLYYRAWFGEGEDDYITSVLFDVRPRIVLPEYTLDAVGASHVFTSEELYDGGNYKEYNAYNNNYTCDGTFSYYVDFSPELQDHGLSLILHDEHENEVAVANLGEGAITYDGMPEGSLEYYQGNDSVDINVSFADLREIMAGSEAENPDIFSICLSIDVNGHNDEYNLYDSHIPINDPWQEVDFENITLESKSFVPKLEFYDWAPGIASVETEWYTALATSVLIKDDDGNVFYERDPYPPEFTDGNGDEQNWMTYFFSFSDEPIDREFAKYYGDGYCDWIVGPANPAYSFGRGPANYKFGLVAKHITKTADTIEGTGVSLSDFIDEDSIEYFNSLVGLSPYAGNGYFTDWEEAEGYDLPGYDLFCKINCMIKVTFEDGVTYRTRLDLIQGGESAGFEVKGEPYILPGVVTTHEDEGCTITVIANYDDENGGTIVNSGDTVKGGTVLTVITEARPGYEIVTKPDDSYTVEGNLDLSAESRRMTYPLSLVYGHSAPPDASVSDLTAVPYGESVTVTAGAPDPGYEFTGWYQPNGKRETEDVSYTFQMYGAVKLEARYRQITGIVTFMSNSNVKKTMTAASITEADYPADVTPYYGYVFDGWDKTVEDVNAVLMTGNNITVNAKFKEAPVNYTVTVYNGEEETPTVTEYSQSVFIPLRAREVEGKNFACWLLDGEILSYRKNVSFKSMSDCTVRAVYTEGTVEAKGTAIMKRITYNVDAKKLQFVSYLTLPDGAKLIAAGLVAASGSGSYDPDTELTEDNAEYVKKSSATGNVASVSYTWNKTNVKPGDVWYSRAYVKYLLDGEEKTVYGDRMVTSAGNDYDTDEHGTAVIRSKSYDPSTKKAVFNSYTTVPENGIIVKAGLVASSGQNFDPTKEVLTAANADFVKLSAKVVGMSTALSYTWSKTKVEPGDTWFVRSYLVYTLNGIEHTVYGELVSLTA
jgi:hypothetical protein